MSCIWLILDRESNIAEDEVYFPIDSQVNWHHFYFKERRIKNQVFTFKEAGSGEILVDEVYQISETFSLIRQLLYFIFTLRPSNRHIYKITWQATFWMVDIWWEIENFQTHTLGKEKGLERLRVQVYPIYSYISYIHTSHTSRAQTVSEPPVVLVDMPAYKKYCEQTNMNTLERREVQ